MKYLITGGAGFIGSQLAAKLSPDNSVVIVDNLSKQIHGTDPDWPSILKDLPNIKLILSDFADVASYQDDLEDSDVVIHLAAETGTGQSMYQIAHYTNINVLATACLLEVLSRRSKPLHRFVFASSRSVYGEGSYVDQSGNLYNPSQRQVDNLEAGVWGHFLPDGVELIPVPTSESHPVSPSSIYAASKLAIEYYLKIISPSFRIPVSILRFQNVYGPGQSLNNPYTGILSIFSNLLRQNRPINIYEDGLESRDFVHVVDVVSSIISAVSADREGCNIYNIGTGQPVSVIDIATKLKAHFESKSEINITGDFRLGDIRHCFADTNFAMSSLNFKASIDINSGLQDFVAWVQNQCIVNTNPEAALAEMSARGLARYSGL